MQPLSPSQSPSNIQQGFELEQQSHVVSSVFPDQAHSVKESAKKMSKVKKLVQNWQGMDKNITKFFDNISVLSILWTKTRRKVSKF